MPRNPSPPSRAGLLPGVLAKSAQAGRPAETLTSHLAATFHAVRELRHRLGRIEPVERVLDEQFWLVAQLAALTHDAGKIPAGFQDMINGRIRSWGERHEVLSLGFLPPLVPDQRLLLWVAEAVVTHHRPLTGSAVGRRLPIKTQYGDCGLDELRTRIGSLDPAVADELAAWLAETGGHLLNGGPEQGEPAVGEPVDVVAQAHQVLTAVLARWRRRLASEEEGLAAVLLQGAVTLADHLSSARGALHGGQPIGPRFPALLRDRFAERGQTLHQHQTRAGEVRGHLLLRAPTGSGKTEAGLLWAVGQVTDLIADGRGVPRVFLTLPYLASINAMAGRLGGLLGDSDLVGVAHSRAASYHLATAIDAADNGATEEGGWTSPAGENGELSRAYAARQAVSRAAATRLFRETIRVGTPYQLLRGALAGPAHSGILLDSANSVFILDELHAYDAKRLGFILAAASMWERLGGRVAVLSATLPTALGDLVRNSLTRPVESITASAGLTPARHRLSTRPYHLTDAAAVRHARERLDAGLSMLVVANNVAHAQQLFDELAPHAVRRHGDDDAAILLHSRFRRADRLRIEGKIIDRYGLRRTREQQRLPGLVVATQVVEVSLDVDFDALLTSGAPLEALLQRFGRVNRIAARELAEVVVHQPSIGPRRGGRDEYADAVYPVEPSLAATEIIGRHEGQPIDEEQATRWLDEVYAAGWGEQWRREVEWRRREFHDAFLTFPRPFDDRSDLADAFDAMFDGTEAVLLADLPAYEAALSVAPGRATGRLLAADYLVPLPGWAVKLASYNRTLGVAVVDGDYDPDRGLLAVRGVGADRYRPGEVI